MKTNEGGAGFGTIGRERSKLLIVVLAIVLIAAAVVVAGSSSVDAEEGDVTIERGDQEINYPSLKEALDAAQDGDIVRLNVDMEFDTGYSDETEANLVPLFEITDKTISIDLNKHTISWAETEDSPSFYLLFFSIGEGADVTFFGDGVIDSYAGNNGAYGIDVLGGTLNIIDGTYYGAPSAVQVERGAANIMGGTFTLTAVNAQERPDQMKYAVNVIDSAWKDGSATLSMTGGQLCYDPSDQPEASGTYVAEGYTVQNDGNAHGDGLNYHSVVPVNAVAEVNGQGYATISDALKASVPGETANVKLISDVTESITIDADMELVLDLNGFTLTNTGGSHTITNNGTLTVIDSSEEKDGSVDNISHRCDALFNNVGAVATLDGGTFERSKEAGIATSEDDSDGGNSYYTIQNYGTLTINEGTTVENSGNYSSMIENGWYTSTDNTTNATATLTITGGKFTGGKWTVKNDSWSHLTISGGTFYNDSAVSGCLLNYGEAEVSGGSFEAPNNITFWNIFQDDSDAPGSAPGILTIIEGDVSGANSVRNTGTMTISGGTFEGLLVFDDSTNTITTDIPYIVVFGNAKFNTSTIGCPTEIRSGSITMEESSVLTVEEGTTIMMNEEASFSGTMDAAGNLISGSIKAGANEISMMVGSLVIDGSGWTGAVTVSGNDIVITGDMADDVEIIVEPQTDGTPTSITWDDFTQNNATIKYQNSNGEEVQTPEKIAEVAVQSYAGDTSVGGISTSVNYYEEGQQVDVYTYDGQLQASPTINVIGDGIGTRGPLRLANGSETPQVFYNGVGYMLAIGQEPTVYQNGEVVTPVNAGTYTTYYAYFTNGSSTAIVLQINWEISPAELHISIDSEKVFDGEEFEFDLSKEHAEGEMTATGLVDGDTITAGTVTTTGINVGTYDGAGELVLAGMTINGTEIGNYTVTVTATLDITKASLSIHIYGEGNYNGSPQSGTIIDEMASGLVSGDSITGGIVVSTGTNVGTYDEQITDWSISGLSTKLGIDNYEVTYDVCLEIRKAPLTITGATIEDKTYDGTTVAMVTSVTFNGLAYGESLTPGTDFTVSGVFDNAYAGTGKIVSITVTALETDTMKNYVLPAEAFTLEEQAISKKVITISSAVVDEKTYDGTENWNVSSVTFGDLVEGESLIMNTDYTVTTKATWSFNAGEAPGYLRFADVTISLGEGLNYTFADNSLTDTLEQVSTAVRPIALSDETVQIERSEAEGGVLVTVTVYSGELKPTSFTIDVTGPSSFSSTSSPFTVTSSGEYTIVVKTTDTNWSGPYTVTETINLHTAEFFTASEMGEDAPTYLAAPELTLTEDRIITPVTVSNVPEGYELAGWTCDGVKYGVGEYVDIPASGAVFYAAYQLASEQPGTDPGTDEDAPTVTIDFTDTSFTADGETKYGFAVTTHGSYTDGNVKGYYVFTGTGASVEYYETDPSNVGWRPLTGTEFGPASGFPFTDNATSQFRVMFTVPGTFLIEVGLNDMNGAILCSATVPIYVDKAVTEPGSVQYTINLEYQTVDGDSLTVDGLQTLVTGTFDIDQIPVLNLPMPVIEGYTFVGWYDTDKYYAPGQVIPTSTSMTLTAKYVQNVTYTIFFGETTLTGLSIGDTVTAPDIVVGEGKIGYWSLGDYRVDPGERYTLASMDVSENNTVTFTAVIEDILEEPTFTITIPVGNGYEASAESISDVQSGDDRTFSVSPMPGYVITGVTASYEVSGTEVNINSYQSGDSWIVSIYGITGNIAVDITVEQAEIVDSVHVEASQTAIGAQVYLSPSSSADDGILPNGTIIVYYSYMETVDVAGSEYQIENIGSFQQSYQNSDASSSVYVDVNGSYPADTVRGYVMFTDDNSNRYYSAYFTITVSEVSQ